MLHALAMFFAGGDNIDPRGINTAVTENVREFCNILFNTVKGARKKMAKIMRENLVRIHICLFAKVFHFPPDICAADRLTGPCNKDRTCCNMLLLGVLQQFLI